MGEKVYGYHAIEEGLKKAGMGSTLYLVRNGGEKINRLEMAAKCTGKVAGKKLSKPELERMLPGVDLRGADCEGVIAEGFNLEYIIEEILRDVHLSTEVVCERTLDHTLVLTV